jgi:hypothetical protein
MLVGDKDTRHALRMTNVKPGFLAVTHHIRQIRFEVTLARSQYGKRIRLRFKTDNPTQTLSQKLFVRRVAIDWIGSDIDYGS